MTASLPVAQRPADRFNPSLVAAMGVAVSTLLASLVVMNERDLTGVLSPLKTLSDTFDFYALPALLLLVLLTLAGSLGAFRTWYIAAPIGLVATVLAGTIGYVVRLATAGAEFSGEAWSAIFSEFFGLNFVFLVAGTVFSATIAPALYRRQVSDMESDLPKRFGARTRKLAFVRIPGANSAVDRDTANDQWEAYVALLDEFGWETREISAAETMPDSVFAQDQVVLLGEVAVLARSASADRRAELPGVRAAVAETEFVQMEIEAPGTLDGGDVLVVEDTVYVGSSAGTNAEGIRGLREIASELGYRVVAVPLAAGTRNLRSVASALPDGTILAWTPGLEQPQLFGGHLEAPEELGAGVLALDAQTVLVPASASETARLVKRLGYRVEVRDISAFERLGGGVASLAART